MKSMRGHKDPERKRLAQAVAGKKPWRRWGPYLSERQWGTVREDYSPHGEAWGHFNHEQSRSRAYRWGEDGIAGFCDEQQRLCFGLALWNGSDPILKERLFGLGGHEGNHGEDVKELYYYVDATPTHSYMRYLYKYPQAAFPYDRLVRENASGDRSRPEFELVDSGAFENDRYFDVSIDYAKAGPEEIHIHIEALNRGPEAAQIWLLPQLWFRNTWSWAGGLRSGIRGTEKGLEARWDDRFMVLQHPADCTRLFTENDTDPAIYGMPRGQGRYKNAFHRYLVDGEAQAVQGPEEGSKAGLLCTRTLGPGEALSLDLCLTSAPRPNWRRSSPGVRGRRRAEADLFFEPLHAPGLSLDARNVQRQAWAGLLWSKQFYHIDVERWLDGDPAQPQPPASRLGGRNRDWRHLNNADVILMPDKWEFPWYASWDLAFHCVALADLDPDFAKRQLVLMTREWYMHPNGQLPAYEWSFDDVNPPVHAWAAWRVYQKERQASGRGDLVFLARIFHKLLLNFNWWVNRKDREGHNVFQGGFLGLDNVGVFDRSGPLPCNGRLEQVDGTAWMALYCLDMLHMALELALEQPHYQDMATKFFEHFLYIAKAMSDRNDSGHSLWDQEDGFYYDLLHPEHGSPVALRMQSIVGLLPLLAVETLEPGLVDRLPDFKAHMEWFLENRPELAGLVSRWNEPGQGQRRLLSLLRGHRMKRLLHRMLAEDEFLSPYGVRSLSKRHREHPYRFEADGRTLTAGYEPGESENGLFGGNSNWRGPVWVPLNYMLVSALRDFHTYYGDDFKVEYPVGSGRLLSLKQVAGALAGRISKLFLLDAKGRRPGVPRGPHGKDLVLFHEHFHGDDGRGLGASHQTGWTALAADLLAWAGEGKTPPTREAGPLKREQS